MLDRYERIVRGEELPRFKLARETATGMARRDLREAGLDELWRAHDRALDRLRTGRPDAAPGGAGLIELKDEIARRILASCCFCEHRCLADRTAGETGVCGVPAVSRYASEFLHYGEEPELVPSHTIFFTGCNFACAYCQNWDIATRPHSGAVADPEMLARVIDDGRAAGARNVNFVGGNPDSHLHTCIGIIARIKADIPVVWNSNAYATVETMKLLDALVDVYLSDFRYGNDACAVRYSGVERYTEVVTRNLLLARDQADLMIRHLVLPGHLDCCTRPVMEWLSRNLPGAYLNLMFQYRPEFRAADYPEIDRRLTPAEMRRAAAMAGELGLRPGPG